MIACIIPARGGSKSIPRKNLVEVCGKPLVAWSIEQAQSSGVDEVIVTTDSQEIADVAFQCGAKSFDRSPETATDNAPTEAALKEVVSHFYLHADAIVLLQPTSPCRQPGDIDNAIRLFRSKNADSLFSARKIEGYTWNAAGRVLSPRDGERKPRQQETRNNLEENGSIYIFKPSILMQLGSRLGGKIVPYLMHPLDSFQIDEPDDIPLVASLMELRLDCHAATD